METDDPLNPFNLASGLIAAISGVAYAVQVYREKITINVWAWAMILIIDTMGLILSYAAGNDRPYLQWGWTIPVVILLAIGISRSTWKWTRIETVSSALCLVSILWWVTLESTWSLLGYIAATFCSCAPQIKTYWEKVEEAYRSTWVWIFNTIAIILTFWAIPSFELKYSLIPSGLLILNLSVSVLNYTRWRL